MTTRVLLTLVFLLLAWSVQAQPAFRTGSFVSAGNASGDALAVPIPTGATTDDIMIIGVYWESDTNTVTPPAGWVSMFRQVNTGSFMIELFCRRHSGSEGSTYTFTPATNGQWRVGVGAAYSGFSGTAGCDTTRRDVTGGNQGDSVVNSGQTAPTVTTTASNDLLIFFYANINADTSVSTVGAASNFRGEVDGVTLADAVIASPSATGTTRPGSTGTVTFAAMHVALFANVDAGGGGGGKPAITRGGLAGVF